MNKYTLISAMALLALTSCGTANTTSESSALPIEQTTVVRTPNEEGGLEGNAKDDEVSTYDTSKAENLLKSLANNKYYTYEITVNISGNEAHFIQYYSPSMFYEENDIYSSSIGYAAEYKTKDLFKFYISEDGTTIYPSTYEYMSYGGEYLKLSGLYSAISLTNFTMISDLEDPDYSVIALSANKFQVTDSDIVSIFQYMTSYGSSITSYSLSTYFEIIDEETSKFRSTIDLGDYGTITGEYVKYEADTFPMKSVADKVASGEIKGVEHYDDVYSLFNDKFSLNNYTLSGIKVTTSTGGTTTPVYNISVTEDYFYFQYLTGSYTNWGFVYVPKNTTVTTKYDETGVAKATTYTLPYGACFEFEESSTGEFYFSKFIGPLESEYKYLEVDELPETGDEDTLYIIEENGSKVAYQYTEVTSGTYGFSEYSEWFNGIQDFPINGSSASFYLSGNTLAEDGSIFFEKNRNKDNSYVTTQTDVLSYLANGLFGWGFQSSTTWMDYITDATIEISKNADGEITSADIGLDVMASVDGGAYGKQNVFYTASDFGTTTNANVETFLKDILED